ncbi:uncharacterized protein [Apostichopus japonicus]|uniref:uncharacterized protein n=1 Tax=Stichopus japonicus TaxID=307972 RepID=UPI003AB7D09D
MIGVLVPNCDTAIRLRCTIIGKNDFDVSDSFLELTSDRCFVSAAPTSSLEHSVPTFFEDRWIIAVMVAFSLIVLCTFVFICLAIKRNRNVSQNTDGRNNLELESNNPLIEQHIENEEALINLLGQLQCRYQGMTYIKSFTWGASIPIHELYTGIKCHISDFTSTKCSITSTSLSNSTVIDNKRVLLIADIGQGKTALCKYMASQWLNKTQEEQKEDILFILPLNDIDISRGIGRNVHNLLSLDITYEVLCDIIRTRKCHLLLDGLKNQSQGNTKYKENKDLIQRLFGNAMWNQYPHLRLWVTSRYVDEQNCVCKEPYTKVTLSGFDDEQIDEYIVKTVSYYKRLSGSPTDSSMECLQNKVRSIFDQNNILSGFKTTVMLTVLFINIITSQLLGVKGPFQEVNLNKLTPLVRSVIAHFNQTFADNSDGSLDTCKEKLTSVRVKLGKELFDSNLAAPLEKRDISNEWIQICQSVGYIKHNKRRLKYNSSANVNQFYDYVQEFCVAEYIVSDNVHWVDLVLKVQHINQAKFSRLLIILCDLSKTMKQQIFRYLAEEQLWNQLADCLYETENDDVIKDIENNNHVKITDFSNPLTRLKGMPSQRTIRARTLDTRYHQNALKVFFINSVQSNIHFSEISLGVDCPIDFLLKLTLPKVQLLVFRSFTFRGPENFKKIVLWAIDETQNVTKGIRFLECDVPNTVDCVCGVEIKIKITRKQNDGKEETLNPTNGTWK